MSNSISSTSRGSRIVIATALILAPLLNESAPPWIALLAPYFAFTAMFALAPLKAIERRLFGGAPYSVGGKMKAQGVS